MIGLIIYLIYTFIVMRFVCLDHLEINSIRYGVTLANIINNSL